MSQPIQQSSRHAFSLEDLAPVAERQVAGDQQAATFVTIGEDLKQKFGSSSTERQVAKFIDDQQVEFVEPFQHAIQRELLLSFFELIHERRRREEFCPQSVPTRGKAQRNRQMRLSSSRLTQQADVTSSGNPFAARKLQNFLFVDRWQRREVVRVQIFPNRKRGLFDA